ncbi:TIGR03986 family CRISPR-associated RAMP protein [Ruminiclostridium herbifermentans]|uniref:TIGR03986 family CRISPR-associated RAMP protein n=1 Tax=Ruminiclostridium herbifermentans TaxID=2488810 RepID=A0A4U7JLA7_9FIRM|nr:TIGR03986 family CRISPR-associated RAMP protein [Ruminiclostridium herbifermentans]QNU68460.1 TIGR03986 family CRISPR-associated RAMP protein [Ruminiclostridium herbifermentans]
MGDTFAPYNFIPFSERKMQKPDKLKAFNRYEDGTYTGNIEYTIENFTELHIGSGKKDINNVDEFFRDGYGNIAIPGSTIRGMLRTNAEILSFSYPEFIDDDTYLYRTFADNCINVKEEYSKEMNATNDNGMRIADGVKAGYIYWKDEKHLEIQPVKEFGDSGTTYFRIHENELRRANCLNNNEYMYLEEVETFEFSKKEEYKNKIELCYGDLEKIEELKKEIAEESLKEYAKDYVPKVLKKWNNEKKKAENLNTEYKPYHHKGIHFNLEGCTPQIDKDGKYIGTLINSSYIDGKTHHFLVSADEDVDKEPIQIPLDLALSFLQDFNNRSKLLGKNKEFYNLPMDGNNYLIGKKHKKLFFYKLTDERLVGFGPTPYFRIFYKNSVMSCLTQKESTPIYDYVKSMFGYVCADNNQDEKAKTEHYKSRINITNCICTRGGDKLKNCEAILLGPHGTSFQLYLNQIGKKVKVSGYNGLTTFNSDDAKLRGYKFYWKRENIGKISDEILSKREKFKNIFTKFEAIQPKAEFTGKIYFENLTKDELGLLICALKLNENEQQTIGKGKPYGYGAIEVKKIKLNYFYKSEEDNSIKEYFLNPEGIEANTLEVTYSKENEMIEDALNEFRNAYKDKLKRDFDIDFDKDEIIQLYQNVHKRESRLSYDRVYMEISKKEFRNRNPLPCANEFFNEAGEFIEPVRIYPNSEHTKQKMRNNNIQNK